MGSRSLLLLALLVSATLLPAVPSALAQGPQVQIEQWRLSSVTDWQSGNYDKDELLVSNDGELRLAGTAASGSFVSAPFKAAFSLNAVGATWRGDIPPGTSLKLEVRGVTADPAAPLDPASAPWGPWQPLVAGDARSQAEDAAYATADVRAFPASTNYLQMRIGFATTIAQASAVLRELSVVYVASTEGPLSGALQGARAPANGGPETLTQRPTMVPRQRWSARTTAATLDRATPRGIVLHQVDVAADASDTPVLLRALAAYQIQVLGWEDMPYHFLIDESGTLYEGRVGGPTSAVNRLAGGDSLVHIAMIGSAAAAPSQTAQATLVGLLAWLSQGYSLPLTGQHSIIQGDQRVARPNLAAHREIVPEAPDPGAPLLELLPQLRQRGDQSLVRSRWFFAEGNVQDYIQRLAFFNPGATSASATVTLLRQGEPGTLPEPETRIVTIPAGGRTDLLVNDIITGTAALPSVVESNAEIIVERSMGTSANTDIDGGPGINELSRVWYFAEGSNAESFRTYLALFNPQTTQVNATLTYMKGDGTISNTTVLVPPQQRVVVSVADVLPGVGFGTRVLAALPLAVERTMRFGAADGSGPGLHTGKGITRLSRSWYFAEGTTARPYQMRLLVLNPNSQTANTTLTFLTPDGTSLTRRYAIPPTTRLVVDVNEVVPELGVATVVDADRALAVERAIYFNDGRAGTVTEGATAPDYTWRFADGRTNDATEYLLISNPGRNNARVRVEFVLADNSRATREWDVPGNSRYTISVHELYPGQARISATVRSTQLIVAERSLYPGGGTRGGSTALGVPGE